MHFVRLKQYKNWIFHEAAMVCKFSMYILTSWSHIYIYILYTFLKIYIIKFKLDSQKTYDQCSVQGLKSKFLQLIDTASIEFNTFLPDICGRKRSHQEEWLLCFMGGTHWEPFSLLNHQITLISDLCSIMTSYIYMAQDSWTLLVYWKFWFCSTQWPWTYHFQLHWIVAIVSHVVI